MKQGLLVLALTVLTGVAQAAESRVYLMALANLGGSNLAQVVFLHESEITQREVCEEARLKGIRERDWARVITTFFEPPHKRLQPADALSLRIQRPTHRLLV